MKKIMIVNVFILIVLASLAYAQPAWPHQFFGAVTVNGNPAPDGFLVVARIESADVAATVVKNGQYGLPPDKLYIQDPQRDREGNTIEFFVQGVKAAEHKFQGGYVTSLDLAVTGDFCGDDVCTSGESCSTCADDCGACSSGSSGSGSSGSGSSHHGGGLSGAPVIIQTQNTTAEPEVIEEETSNKDTGATCTPDWVCSDWLDCVGAVQKRVCVDSNKCGTDESKPDESRSCETPADIMLSQMEKERQEAEAKKSGLSGITGAIIGGGTASWIAGLILLAIIAGAVFYLKKRK